MTDVICHIRHDVNQTRHTHTIFFLLSFIHAAEIKSETEKQRWFLRKVFFSTHTHTLNWQFRLNAWHACYHISPNWVILSNMTAMKWKRVSFSESLSDQIHAIRWRNNNNNNKKRIIKLWTISSDITKGWQFYLYIFRLWEYCLQLLLLYAYCCQWISVRVINRIYEHVYMQRTGEFQC